MESEDIIVAQWSPLDFPSRTLSEVWALIEHHVSPLPSQRVPLREAWNRVLAEDIVAKTPVPPFPTVRMDGYAVRSEDGEVLRRPVGAQRAGEAPHTRVGRGEAVWVTTGAVLPAGADAVIPVEHVEQVTEDRVRLRVAPSPGMYVRPVGADIRVGERVLARGTRLRSGEIGIVAAVGMDAVTVHSRPRVAVLATGNELQEPGTALAAGKIWVSNRYALLAAVREVGGVPVDMGVVSDDPKIIAAAFRDAVSQADVVVSTGGVSMGDADWTRDVLVGLGDVLVGRISVHPLSPAMVVMVGDVPVLALPGSPAAAWVSFYALVWKVIRQREGEWGWSPTRLRVRAAREVVAPREDAVLVPARVEVRNGDIWVEPTSGGVWSGVGARMLLYIAPGRVSAGQFVEGWWLRDG